MPVVPNDLELYPNSPLRDVACEIRFPGEMEAESNRHVFWNAIRDRYSQILVPRTQSEIPPALQHYRFADESGKRTIAVAINSLAFSETEYSGHESFIEEFCRLADVFHNCFPRIERINRVGWRYVNVIPFAAGGEFVPVGNFLKATIGLPDAGVLDQCKSFDVRLAMSSNPTLNVRLALLDDPPRSLLLDIDVVFDQHIAGYSEYRTLVQEARDVGRRQFEALITDEYRQHLRGEDL